MATITIHIDNDIAEFFMSCDMMVTPGTDHEFQQFRNALAGLADAVGTVRKALSTLQQLSETKGANAFHIGQTLDIRVSLGRSARVGRGGPADGKTLQ
jgi:hypothetical protein